MSKPHRQSPAKQTQLPLDEAVLIYERKRFLSYDQHGIPQLSIYTQLGIILWMTGFFALFYSFYLPNNSSISRLNIWELLTDLLLENVFPTPEGDGSSTTNIYKGWSFFPQRLPLFGLIITILICAWGYGSLTLKMFRLNSHLSLIERLGFALALGLGLVSLLTLFFGYIGLLNRWIILTTLLLPALTELVKNRQEYRPWLATPFNYLNSIVQVKIPLVEMLAISTMCLFVWTMLLGSVLPETDFDVREYHLQGPKEFFLNGQITMLKHNVYTSFPFLTEMISLLAMVLMNDWFYGSLVGKGVLMSFAPISALLIYALGKRVWSHNAGLFAALIFLTTPWVYRFSIIAYTEGALCCYTIATLFACTRTIMLLLHLDKQDSPVIEPTAVRNIDHTQLFSWTLLTGLFAGCAVSTKYPGLVTVTIPLCTAVIVMTIPRIRKCFLANEFDNERISLKTLLTVVAGLTLGILITFGPWVLKNIYETGNPVYPLMYGVFGGEDLTPELVAKWKRGHAPDNYHLTDLGMKLVDVTLKSDWQSPLVFSLFPLACIIPSKSRKLALLYGLYVLWYFGVWWVCTHRLDRFWVPLLPVACLVAGMGYSNLCGVARWHASGLITAAVIFNLGFITTTLCGNNSYLHDLTKSRELFAVKSISMLDPLMKNQNGSVLAVGEAQVFDANYPVIYNTVFDDSIFEQWCTNSPPATPDADWTMRDPLDIKKIFAEHHVKYILVNWQEILRYRETYGYTKYVTPKRFTWLQEQGIVGKPVNFEDFEINNYRKLDSFRSETQQLIKQEMPELLSTYRRVLRVKLVEYYPVLNTAEE